VTGVLATLTLGIGADGSLAANANTPYSVVGLNSPDGQAGQRWGERLADANVGSGVRDLFVSSYLADFSSHDANILAAGEVSLVDSRTQKVRYEIRSPEPQANAYFGFYIANLGDVNHDGTDDLAVGAPFENVDASGNACTAGAPGCNVSQGKVFVFEGSTGKLLYSINSPHPQQSDPAGVGPGGFGARISTAGDVTGDGVPDIIIGAPGYDLPAACSHLTPIPANCHKTEGESFIMNGATGALVRVIDIPASDEPAAPGCNPSCGRIGGTVTSVGDINGDGVPDQQVAAYSLHGTATTHGRVYLISGKDGSVLARIDPPEPGASQFFGLQDAAPMTPGDVNGDGVPDIYVDAFTQTGAAGPSQGKAWVFDGKKTVATGQAVLLYEVVNPQAGPSTSSGFSASKTYYDGDGTPDLISGGIGSPDHAVFITDGKTGALLKTLEMPAAEFQPSTPGNAGSTFGWSVRSLGDVNGDGAPDYAVSAPEEDVGGLVNIGKVYFLISQAAKVTKLGLTNNRFVVAGRFVRTKRKKGTTFSYTLSGPATVKIAIAEQLPGRRKGKQCVAPTHQLRHAKKCTRTFARGRLTQAGKQGINRLVFPGRIGSKALSPGSYTATITATDAAHDVSTPVTISFTILKP
jgi:hypothetical protein